MVGGMLLSQGFSGFLGARVQRHVGSQLTKSSSRRVLKFTQFKDHLSLPLSLSLSLSLCSETLSCSLPRSCTATKI